MPVIDFVGDSDFAMSTISPLMSPVAEREVVKVCIVGSLRGIDSTVKTLYSHRFAEVGSWSRPQPTGNPGEYVSVLRRYVMFGWKK